MSSLKCEDFRLLLNMHRAEWLKQYSYYDDDLVVELHRMVKLHACMVYL